MNPETRKGRPVSGTTNSEITTINTESILPQATAAVNPLRNIREKSGASAADIVGIVQRRHPKYDKTLQSKCERTELYGIQIADDSMKDLRDELLPKEIRSGHDRHRLTARVSCRLEPEEHSRFLELVQRCGYDTVQDYLSDLIRKTVEENTEFSPARSCRAQAEYCRGAGLPHFAPADGRCYRCHAQIYESQPRTDGTVSRGIDVYRAGHSLITGCPHCHYSFVE